MNIKTPLTLVGLADGRGAEVQGVACHGLEGVADALWNQDDLEEGVEGVHACRGRTFSGSKE